MTLQWLSGQGPLRARVDGPALVTSVQLGEVAAPRARGWTVCCVARRASRRGRSARAWMDRLNRSPSSRTARPLRARVDEPWCSIRAWPSAGAEELITSRMIDHDL